MYKTLSSYEFANEFKESQTRKEQFSYDALDAIYEYMEELGEDCGHDDGFEFDMIAICCDYTEYDSFEDFKKDSNNDIETIEDLQDETTVLFLNNDDTGENGFVIQNY